MADISTITTLLSIFVGFSTITATLVLIYQIRSQRKTDIFKITNTLLTQYFELIPCFERYREEVNEIKEQIKNDKISDRYVFFETMLGFENVTKIAYFFEFVGEMVFNKRMDITSFTNTFTFPDLFWEETAEIREFARNVGFADFWVYFEHLRELHVSIRAFNEEIKMKGDNSVVLHKHVKFKRKQNKND